MNKLEYLKVLDELNFDKNEYHIISGGAMVMYGLREKTNDIDLQISKKLYNEIKNKYNIKLTNKYPNHYEFNNIEVLVKDFNSDDIVFIDSYPVLSILKEREWKLKNNREKDKKDLELIEKYLLDNKIV